MIYGLLRGYTYKELDLVVFDNAPVSFVVDLVTDKDLVSSHYVCVSLTEDQCSVVQRDIPKILEAIARFLGEVDKWHAKISAASSLTVTAASVNCIVPSPLPANFTPDMGVGSLGKEQDWEREP